MTYYYYETQFLEVLYPAADTLDRAVYPTMDNSDHTVYPEWTSYVTQYGYTAVEN